MIITDEALRRRESADNPIRVGLLGPGFMGRGIARQILLYTQGMRLSAVYGRDAAQAARAFTESGIRHARYAKSEGDLAAAITTGVPAFTDEWELVCSNPQIDVIIDATGAVEFGARAALKAIDHGKHVIANAETDATVGPLLKLKADRAGVVYTTADGDQPGVQINLHRFVQGMGIRPVLCGNIKGLHDPYRNPTTQQCFAKQWGQKPEMVTSFADGTKISVEQAIVANATGMRVLKRGMVGASVEPGTPLSQALEMFPLEELADGPGCVDYIVGAVPGPGVFVIGKTDDPVQQHYLHLYKLGTGPFYLYYIPYHLCHFEVPNTIARAALFGDAAGTPLSAPKVDVVTLAKTDIPAGAQLDGIGHYLTYGVAENSEIAHSEKLLPIGLAGGCHVKRTFHKDEPLTYDDVELPNGRLIDMLRTEQDGFFFKAGRDTTFPLHISAS